MWLLGTPRAISPVVATALLVLIAVLVSVLLYTWVSGMVATTPPPQTALQEKIKIDAVSASAGSSSIKVYVHNIGDVNATISSVYVVNAETGKVLGFTKVNELVRPGDVLEIEVPLATALKKGDVILVKAVTEYGNEAVYVTTIT